MEPINNASDLYNVGEIKLIYKSKVKASQRPQITSSRDAYQILLNACDQANIELVVHLKLHQNRCVYFCFV